MLIKPICKISICVPQWVSRLDNGNGKNASRTWNAWPSRNVEGVCGNYSGGHEYSSMASENKSEKEVVGESRSLLCDEVGMRVAVTRRGRWRLDELGEGGVTQVVLFPPSTERVVLSRLCVVVLDSGISSPLRAPSR